MSKLKSLMMFKDGSLVFSRPKVQFFTKAFLASLGLVLSALVVIPMYPVPMYLFIPALVTLALFGGSKLAFTAACMYLVEASMGLPVLSGGRVDPLWLMSPVGGYVVTYPLVGFVTGYLNERWGNKSILGTLSAIMLGQLILYTFGIANLSLYFGFDTALKVGLYPFMPKALLMLVSTTFIYRSLLLRRS